MLNNNTILRPQLRFKNDLHNKIALNGNDDKRLQTFDRVTAYSYGANAFKVCKSEMMAAKKYSSL